jgi:hypothetical protein
MTLTVALAVLAGLVLAGIVAHGAWQSRRSDVGRQVASAVPREAREPVFDADGVAEVQIPPPDGEAAHAAEAATAIPSVPAAPRLARRTVPRLDALIDALVTLRLDAPVSGELATAHLPPTRRAGGKPFLIEGLNAETGEWEHPQPGQRYGEFQAGVQMANRTGAINEIEFSEFVQTMQAFADAIGATPDVPDMLDVVARGRELDAFAGQHDAQLAVHLRARSSGWSIGYLQQHAARHGFVPGAVPGRLVLPAAEEGAPPVLTLAFDPIAALSDDPSRAVLRDVTLAFDVPQTDPSVEPFTQWQASAQALSLGMDAEVVDDQGRPLSTAGFAAIGAELGQLYDALAARDLAAGSAAARRLFS